METEILNARIVKPTISMADHGCLTFGLFLNGGSWGIMFGGHCIGHGYLGADEFSAKYGDGLEAMMRIMDTVGVDRWEDLKDKYIRAEVPTGSGRVHKIGNLMEDKWFDIDEFFETKAKEHKYKESMNETP